MTYQLTIGADERIAIAGKTGSGKTFLSRALCANLDRLMVLDPKGTLGRADWNLEKWGDRTQRALKRGDPVRARIPAPLDGDWDRFLWAAYSAGGVTVYIDETYGILPRGANPSPALTALITRGRELGIGLWAAMQRPTRIPLFLLSEAEWLLSFRLQLAKDKDRMSEMMGGDKEGLGVPDKFGFWFYHTEWDRPAYCAGLTIKKKGDR